MLVSVVIPTCNRASMIGDAIDSALRQTYSKREIIVMDDGSTDETPAVLARYGSAIRVLRQPNAGAGVARNRAIDSARGDLIAFLDDDDEWFDFKLALQVAILRARPDVGFLFTEFVVRKEEDNQVLRRGASLWLNAQADWAAVYERAQPFSALGIGPPPGEKDFTIYSGNLYRPLLHHYYVLPTTAVVRRAAVGHDVRFAEGPIVYEDWEFFARLARTQDGAFADVETAVNRGHRTPGRLTLCSALVKHSAHVAMLEGVWEKDPAFMAAHGGELRALKSELLTQMAKHALLEERPDLAREALRRRRRLAASPPRADTALYAVLSHAPGGAGALRLARRSLH
ncbi:MAG: glycosyltransferase family A protein, partial [Vicinamibacterales bacterium]